MFFCFSVKSVKPVPFRFFVNNFDLLNLFRLFFVNNFVYNFFV